MKTKTFFFAKSVININIFFHAELNNHIAREHYTDPRNVKISRFSSIRLIVLKELIINTFDISK